MITVYSLPVCPNCLKLKKMFIDMKYPYIEKSLEDKEVLIDVRMAGVYANEAPVLRIDNNWFESRGIFDADGSLSNKVMLALKWEVEE